MNKNDTTNWERRLKGEVVPLVPDMTPDYGFYRVPTKDRTSWRPVAYWYEGNGELRCWLGTKAEGRMLSEDQATTIWSWASQNPVRHEIYKAVVEEGQPWPDDNTVVRDVSNRAPEDNSFEAIQERIDDLVREAERLMKKGAARTQEESDQAANVATKLGEYWNKADRARDHEKRPFLDEANRIQAKWKKLLEAAEIHKTLKQIVCSPWLSAQKKAKEKAEKEAREAASEAQRKARAAQAEAERTADEAVQSGSSQAHVEATAAAQRAGEALQDAVAASQTAHVIASTKVTAGTQGRRSVHLRTEKVYSIADRDALFAFLKTNPKALAEIDEVMLKHGKAIAKTGLPVAGLKIDEEEMAA